MVQLASTTYGGANQTHLAELAGPSRGGTGPAWAPPESDPYSSLVRRMVDRQCQRDAIAMPRPTSSLQAWWTGPTGHARSLTPVSATSRLPRLSRARADTGESPLPCTEIATASSSVPETPATSSRRWKPPTSAGPWWNWAYSRSSPARLRPRAGWNAWRGLFRTGW